MIETKSSTRMPKSELSARKKHVDEDRMGKKGMEEDNERQHEEEEEEEEEKEEGEEKEEEEDGGDKRPKMSPFAKLWHKGTNEEEMEKGNLKQEGQPNEPGGITSRL